MKNAANYFTLIILLSSTTMHYSMPPAAAPATAAAGTAINPLPANQSETGLKATVESQALCLILEANDWNYEVSTTKSIATTAKTSYLKNNTTQEWIKKTVIFKQPYNKPEDVKTLFEHGCFSTTDKYILMLCKLMHFEELYLRENIKYTFENDPQILQLSDGIPTKIHIK